MPVWLKAGIPAVCLALIIGIGISAAVKFLTYYRMTEMRVEALNGNTYELIGIQSVTPQQD